MVKLSKAILARQIKSDYFYIDDGDTLENLVEKYGKDAYLDIVWDYSDTSIRIVTNREETDEEYAARIKAARDAKTAETARKKAIKDKREADERALYEQLKAKFG